MKNGSDNESEEIVEGDELLDESLPLMVWLDTRGNPDYRQDPSRPLPGVEPKMVDVRSLREASAVVRRFIDEHQIGGGNWAGGHVYLVHVMSDERKAYSGPIARISYNGRVRRFAAASPAARP